MKRLFQGLIGLVALIALLGWLVQQRRLEPTVVEAPLEIPPPGALGVLPPSPLAAAQKAALSDTTGQGRPLADRFAQVPVLDSRETEIKTAEGQRLVRRIRLVRDLSYKYPLLRVEDETVRTSQGDRLVRQRAMVADHVILKPQDPQLPEAQLLALLGDGSAQVRRRMPASGLWLVSFADPGLDTVPHAVSRLSKLSAHVRVVEPDHVVTAQATPNDSSFSTLWGMHNTGQSSGTVDADIDAPEAWDMHTGSRSVIVGVIDSGIDLTHPDLVANLWTNPYEIPSNGLDDDGNGYVDDTRGWDFVNGDNDPSDDNGHGTHCAGTIGAVGNNGTGLSGVCWQVSLLGLKFLNASANGFESDAAEAVAYATGLGVTMTSNSYTGTTYTQVMREAIDQAHQAGILFVAAAGNNSSNVDLYPEYPAAYECPNILSVAATTRTDTLASFSNYGATQVDLAAPGNEINSLLPGGSYGFKNGTSMAAPHVTGACALLKSYKPVLTHLQLRDLVLNTVNPLPALSGKCVTGGRLNLYNAMVASNDIQISPAGNLTAAGPIGGPFSPISQVITLTNNGTTARPWTAATPASWVSVSPGSGTLAIGASTQVTVTVNTNANQLLAATHTAVITVISTATGRVQTRNLALEVSAAPVYSTPLDVDPGWSRTGEWAYGTPLGQGGLSFGNPDPSSGATGSRVFGINLAGDYAVNSSTAQFLTAGPFDLSGKHATKLRYQRWLNADFQPWVITSVELSTNGTAWSTVWTNTYSTPREDVWTFVEHNLAAQADGQSQVYVRWRHQVTTTDAYPQSGWNIDDIELHAVPDKQVRLLVPATLTEGGTVGSGKVMVAPAPTSNLTVSLVSNRPGEEVSFPASVIVPAGQTEVSFTLTPINDTRIDGSQSVTLTASATSWPVATASLLVHDNETTTISLFLPATVTEGAAPVTNQARVSLPAAVVVPVTINLSSNDVTELQVPATVTIPQGQSQAFFTLTMPDDDLLDGTQSATVTASVMNWPFATATLQVLDNEAAQLSVTLSSPKLESAGVVAGGGLVSVPGVLVTPLTVNLVSNDTTELQVPASVVLAAGSSSQSFDLILMDDALADGNQTVTVTATAAGFTSGQGVITVTDDEQPALPANPSPVHQYSPTHPETDLAWNYDATSGGAPQSYEILFGTNPVPVELVGAVTAPALELPRLEPGTTYYWQVITHRDAQTRAGPVWSFTVPPVGNVDHFGWSDVPTVAARGTAFNSRITAYDVWDNEVSSFAGPVSLTANAQAAPTTTGTGSYTWFYPLACYYHDARTQAIYTPAEVGAAGRLTSLALDVVKLPGQLLKDFTIRMKHTPRASFSATERAWEGDGWTTVFSGNVTVSTLGWNTLPFSVPFDYDGVTNLMVDISFNNNDYSNDGTVRSSITTQNRTLTYRTDSAYASPLSWTGTVPLGIPNNTLPNLRFTRAETDLALTPATSGSFVHGSWSGSLTLQVAVDEAWLTAALPANPDMMGESTLINIVAVNDLVLAPEPLYTGGTSNLVSWNSLGAAYDYEIQRATVSNFSDAISTGFISNCQQAYSGLTDGQTYHYRARARSQGFTGAWSAPQRSTQDATPPDLVLTPGTGGVVLLDHLLLQGNGTDMSGVSAVTVNGSGATSSNSFAAWTHSISGLVDGLNTFTVMASDNAVPPNTRSETWSILRIADPAADADANGVGAFFEHVFYAGGPSGMSALPQVGVQADGGTGEKHLTLSYRRLLSNPSGVQYLIETSSSLTSWEAAGAEVEQLSAVPTGDGVTETVTIRLMPAMAPGLSQFVRVRVVVP